MEATQRSEPAEAGALLQQANLARVRGQWGEATELCVTILRAQPGNADAHSLLGDIYRDQGATEDALQWYRMAMDLHPNPSDEAKLNQMEARRFLRMTSAAPRSASAGAVSQELDGSVSSGTTQLMGLSPKRWLNTITIVSTAFLAATLLVLLLMQGTQRNAQHLPRPMKLPPGPTMPTADAAPSFSSSDPNRPTTLPLGETVRHPKSLHRIGTGLEPDQPNGNRTIPIPTPGVNTSDPSNRSGSLSNASGARRNELPPAAVQTVRPMLPSPALQPNAAPTGSSHTLGVAGQTPDREGPAPGAGAGVGAISPEEQERINHGH